MERQTRLGVDGDKFSRREKVTTGELELKNASNKQSVLFGLWSVNKRPLWVLNLVIPLCKYTLVTVSFYIYKTVVCNCVAMLSQRTLKIFHFYRWRL